MDILAVREVVGWVILGLLGGMFRDLTTSTVTSIGIVTLVVLIVLSSFFSSAEIALFKLADHRLEALVTEGVPGARAASRLLEDPHRTLVTILVGNNLVNIAMSSIATGLLALYYSQAVAVAGATLGITAIVLLFGEAVPKSYAVEHTDTWSLRVARPLKYTEFALLPIIIVIDHMTRYINRLMGMEGVIESPYVTRDELQQMIEASEEEGVIEEDEHELLKRIFRFSDAIAKEVMTPRLDIDAVSGDEDIDAAIQACVQSGHDRIPVYQSNLDNVIGTVNLSELIREHNYGEGGDVDLRDLVQPTLHVPESKNVDELLQEMRESRMEMVIVIDEFGTTEGLITVEDLVEEIVGEILAGGEDHPIEYVTEDTLLVRGEVNIHEVNEALEVELPEGEEFETIAGFIFNRAGRLVEEGEEVTYKNVRILVEEVDNTRITKARVERTGEIEPDDEGESEDDAEEITEGIENGEPG